MVGVFGLGSKSPSSSRGSHNTDIVPHPPPPYAENESDPSVLLAETTTTTTQVVTTTTHTTTHFFSLPLWRRRAPAATTSASARQSLSDPNADENGIITNGPTNDAFMLEKDLPPIPPDANYSVTPTPSTEEGSWMDVSQHSHSRSTPSLVISPPPAKLRKSSRPETAASVSQPAYALAQASLGSLGLGLTQVMPQAMASSSSSEVNSVEFSPSADSEIAPSRIRRAKSHRSASAVLPQDLPADIMARRRSRGVSMGPYNLLEPAGDGKGKERERAEESGSSPSSTLKTVSRKSSFFSRKRIDSEKRTPPLPKSALAFDTIKPALPSLQPVSPFNIDTPLSTSDPPPHSSGLSRRHSDRTRTVPSSPTSPLHVTIDSPNSPTLPISSNNTTRRRNPRRPSTADSANRSRARFLFVDSHTPTPPLPLPPIQKQEKPPDEAIAESNPPTARPRAATNPPLLHRLSMSLFSSASNNTNSNNFLGNPISASPTSAISSPRPSLGRPSEVPKPRTDEESPEIYLERLIEAVSKAEVATVLASSADPFHARALEVYLGGFDFTSDPLDVALRKLLMDVGLPRETQQIDRVMEAFANRYKRCNPDLFTSDDHPYILAFSLIMLHTDAFNKSNKRKMTKPDYVKNTRLPGLHAEVLDCFYDNIVFAPFIFIEDPLDVNGQRGLMPDGGPSRMSTMGGVSSSPSNGSSSNLLGRGNRIDPYFLITRNLLDPLRVNVESFVPLEDPYSYEGTAGPWDAEELRRAFAKAGVIEVNTFDSRRMSVPYFNPLSVGGVSSPIMNPMGQFPEFMPPIRDIWTIKVTKVGLLGRKDDTVEGGRKALNRRWRDWSVVLTGSQLLLFRDPLWAINLLAQDQTADGHVLSPPDSMLRPDELISVKDSIAVFDRSYTKHEHTLRFVLPDGRQIMLRAATEEELNEWISRINYASAFKTAGVRMRTMGMSSKEIKLTGTAAAASHLKDMQHLISPPSPRVRTWDDGKSDHSGKLSSVHDALGEVSQLRRNSIHGEDVMDADKVPTAPDIESSHQFKATFDEVKAELAAGRLTLDMPGGSSSLAPGRVRAGSTSSIQSPLSDESTASGFPARSRIIQSKVRDLEAKISATQTQLDADMRFIRNIAVLTPFQRTTRDKLSAAVQNASKRIMQVRLEMAKLVCHRDVLSNDLAAEERDWFRNKKVALRAAKEVLESRREIPRMTLSMHDDAEESTSTSSQPAPRSSSSGSHIRESSIRESFYSAQDFGPDSSSYSASPDDQGGLASFLEINDSPSATPLTDVASDGGSVTLTGEDEGSKSPGTARPSYITTSSVEGEDSQAHQRFYTAAEAAEEAEDWHKTRAAKRVSLVKLPTELRISTLFGKVRTPTAAGSIPEMSTPPSPRLRNSLYDRSGLPYSMFD